MWTTLFCAIFLLHQSCCIHLFRILWIRASLTWAPTLFPKPTLDRQKIVAFFLGYPPLERVDFVDNLSSAVHMYVLASTILLKLSCVLVQVVWNTVEPRLIRPWPEVRFPAIILSSKHTNSLSWAQKRFLSILILVLTRLVYRFFWIRAGMMGWLLINLSIGAKQYIDQGSLSLSMALFQTFCAVWFCSLCFLWYFILVPNLCKNCSNISYSGRFTWLTTFIMRSTWHQREYFNLGFT